jgi:hypothetical protein
MKTNIYSKLYSEHRAWDKHYYDDPGYVSRTTHAQQLVNWPGQVEQNTARGTSTALLILAKTQTHWVTIAYEPNRPTPPHR